MNNFAVKIQPKISLKSKYIKTLRANHFYLKAQIPKIFTSKNIIEKNIYNKFYKTYSDTNNCYNIKIINEIITNQRSHIVAEFKDFLIKDDNSEFIWKFYSLKDSRNLLTSIINYYEQTSLFFPNYILLSENKYLYKNIQRKQKLINILEEKDEAGIIKHKKMGYDTDDFFDTSNKVFNSNILDSILNESNTSQIKKSLFGVSTENSNVTDNDGDNKLNIVVNNINKIEEKLYVDFLHKKKLKIDKNIIYKKDNLPKEKIIKKEKDQNLMNIKKIVDKVNNKNVIISRNRHKSVEISKYSKFTKNESQLNNNNKRAKTESINDTFSFNKILNKNNGIMFSFKNSNENEKSIDNNKNIIYNNIYKTDLYLNINNNIIIKETKNKSKENKSKHYTKVNQNVVNKLDFNKLKNINIPKNVIHSDKRKYIKKNDINNLLLSIGPSNKEISESKREYNQYNIKTGREQENYFDMNYNKNIIKHRKNKTDVLIENYTKNKNYTSRTLEIKKNNKIMIYNFKNTLNNLMSVINKKGFKRNINTRKKNNTNYRNGYSNKYSSSSINNKEKIRFIESYYDSITNIKNNSMKIKNNKIKNNKENLTTYKNSLTFRRNISHDSKLMHNTQKNSKNKNKITTLNTTKSRKIKKIINNFNPYQNDEKKTNKKINLKKINHSKNKEIFSLTARESFLNERNKYNKKNFKINYTSFIKRTNHTFKISENRLNTPNFTFRRPKSFGNKKEYFKINTHNNKGYLSLPKKLNNHKKIFRTDFNNILRERIDKLNKTVKFKRNPLYNKLITSKNNSKIDSSLFGNINTNTILNINKKSFIKTKERSIINKKEIKEINLNKNQKQKIKRFKSTCQDKKNYEVNYSQIELRKKKYRDINKNRRGYRLNPNVKNNKNRFNNTSYTDRIYQTKKFRANSLVNKI